METDPDWIEDQHNEKLNQWIRRKLRNRYVNKENTKNWDTLKREYEEEFATVEYLEDIAYDNYDTDYLEDIVYNDFLYDTICKSRIEIFNENIANTKELISLTVKDEIYKKLLVMLYGYIISTLEGYLYSTFIDIVLPSDALLCKLIKSDKELAKETFTLADIFIKRKNPKQKIEDHLKGIVYHNIKKIKPMYKDILNIDFQDVEWLFKSILIRHDCVHRAGYDKEGNEINFTKYQLENLIDNCEKLVSSIEEEVSKFPTSKMIKMQKSPKIRK